MRDRLILDWLDTNARVRQQGVKQVAYLSMEFLKGRELKNALDCFDLEDDVRAALARHGVSLDEVYEQQVDPALGNGGLGRLAACFLDSMATLGIAGIGYGIRYEYGMFRQELVDGWQMEQPDEWLTSAHPWEFPRPERTYAVSFGGRVEHRDHRAHWIVGETVLAVAFDRVVPGYESHTVNTLRLWSPKPTHPIDLSAFNRGALLDAVARKIHATTVGRVLYPDDSTADGANIEIAEAVGQENIFIFGLDVAGVRRLRAIGYVAGERYAQDRANREAVDQIGSGLFSPGEPDRHRPIVEALLQQGDRYLVLADFATYMAAQDEVDRTWADPTLWTARAIRNVAGMARFSSDRAVREYADRIWSVGALQPRRSVVGAEIW